MQMTLQLIGWYGRLQPSKLRLLPSNLTVLILSRLFVRSMYAVGGPKLWTQADQKPVKIFRPNLLGVITSRASYKRPILVKIVQRGFSRHIHEMYTFSGVFSYFFGGSLTSVQPRPLNRFSRVKRRVSAQGSRFLGLE